MVKNEARPSHSSGMKFITWLQSLDYSGARDTRKTSCAFKLNKTINKGKVQKRRVLNNSKHCWNLSGGTVHRWYLKNPYQAAHDHKLNINQVIT
ncbi:hypothetical protein AFLA_012531 [Aspergillus flavus NRRL3357]|nr:hypothetical protein AFLA_012531 [Aspergillus flavus NRRL3357]